MLDDIVGSALHRVTPNRVAFCSKLIMPQARQIGLRVARGLTYLIGSEFINDQLHRYCLREEITFTRGRAGRKNYNAYFEQNSWSVVRRALGYGRYDSPAQLDLLNTVYVRLHFYVDFFLPVTKLEEKVRIGSKDERVCDHLQTPYARVLASHQVSDEDKPELREAYGYLDLIELRRRIDEFQVPLLKSLCYNE